ncbi:MAG: hypothetical protein LIP03_05200 [Bacteroidales bacterium]|nr:hypothetical protein [Bacteroidales bacterium]
MKLKLFFYAAMAALAVSATSCNKASKSQAETPEEQANDVMLTEAMISEAYAGADGVAMLADDNLFRPDQKVPCLVALDFNATWCIPCKKLTPAFDKASEEYQGKAWFFAVDIDNMHETAQAFGIESIPTVIFLLPDGTNQKYVGLGDFATDEQLSSDMTEEQLTEVIYGNMKNLISKALGEANEELKNEK